MYSPRIRETEWQPRAPARGTFFRRLMRCQQVACFIDGLNLYHAISIYFSAYAEHIPEPLQRCQKAYIQALKLVGIKPVLGHFKEKKRNCPYCNESWVGHEEKESDVNLAIFLLDLANQNAFDRALVISNDSDLAPAIQLVRERFPQKRITTVAPPERFHSRELIRAASDKTKVRLQHLERCLLPEVVTDASSMVSVARPFEYLPRVLKTV